jgi:5'-deoxynucleotidase YfbR-like HD superfamily hydrolase
VIWPPSNPARPRHPARARRVRYLHATPSEQITADQTAALPQAVASLLRGLVAEYEDRASPEADCARDADKLEMLLQALDYRAQGHRNTEPFMETALAALRTRRAGGSARPR